MVDRWPEPYGSRMDNIILSQMHSHSHPSCPLHSSKHLTPSPTLFCVAFHKDCGSHTHTTVSYFHLNLYAHLCAQSQYKPNLFLSITHTLSLSYRWRLHHCHMYYTATAYHRRAVYWIRRNAGGETLLEKWQWIEKVRLNCNENIMQSRSIYSLFTSARTKDDDGWMVTGWNQFYLAWVCRG